MLVRIVLILGFALIAFAGGAMGWQYWQGLSAPPAATATATTETEAPAIAAPAAGTIGKIEQTAAPSQNWLISPGGGLVERDMVRAYLRQDRFVDRRFIDIAFVAPLSALLQEGEALPGMVFRQAFADIRAKAFAPDMCARLVATIAATCDVHFARAPENSLSPDGESAEFALRLVYTLKAEAEPLQDLASHVLQTDYTGLMDVKPAPEQTATLPAFLDWVLAEMPMRCRAAGPNCRIVSLSLAWRGPDDFHVAGTIAWLAPMPAGMYPAPPLPEAMPEGE